MSSLYDSGSGFGYPPIFTSIPSTSSINGLSQPINELDNNDDFVSTPLISAKCWNNYENLNECRHLNVIGPGDSQQISSSSSSSNYDDGTLITPIVIFESSSSTSPATIQNKNRFNDRPNHLTTTTIAPDYGSTILPDLRWPLLRWGPRNNSSNPNVSVGDISRHMDNSSSVDATTTRKPISFYFVSQRPKPISGSTERSSLAPSTKRKCVDENDSDCDEPIIGDFDADNLDGDNLDDADADGDADEDGDDVDVDINNDDTGSDMNSLGNSIAGGGKTPKKVKDNEIDNDINGDFGSGSSPPGGTSGGFDDDEGGTDDAPDEETSTVYKVNPPINSPGSSTTHRPTTINPPMTTSQQGANIEVVVHPTLPPSFPMLTIATHPAFTPGQTSNNEQDTTTTPSTTTTLIPLIPDDTFKSKPIYPSTTPGRTNDGAEDVITSAFGLTNSQSSTFKSNEEDEESLNTFKPMPLATTTTRPIQNTNLLPSQQANSNSRLAVPSIPPSRFLWSTSRPSQQSGLFGTTLNPWVAKGPGQSSDHYSSTSSSKISSPSIVNSQQQLIQNQDTSPLSNIIIYGSIGVLGLLALIMAIIAFGMHRRSSARARELIQKAHAMQNAAAANYHFAAGGGVMQNSMSQASHLMANMQQPGLLSTYAPGSKGMSALGKVTSSIVRPGSKGVDHDQLLQEEQDSMQIQMSINQHQQHQQLMQQDMDEQQSSLNSKLDLNSIGESNQLNNLNNNINDNNNGNGWSTDDRSGTTTASQSGSSQNSQESRMSLAENNQYSIKNGTTNGYTIQNPQPQHNRIIQFASNHGGWSSGSDSRQHSSSISDSQGDLPQQTYPPHPQPAPLIYPQRSMINGGGVGPNVVLMNGQTMQNSRSVEDLMERERMIIMGNGHQTPAQPRFPIQLNGQPTPFKQAFQQSTARVNLINSLDPNLQYNHQSVNPTQIAMNPLATLTRRYPGLGLSRNILSEDTSSSLVTASPSLARTLSSSSSFALNQQGRTHNFTNVNQIPIDNQVRPKPIMDPMGRLMNDYTPQQQMAPFNSTTGTGNEILQQQGITRPPPMIPGRNNRSEAWYV